LMWYDLILLVVAATMGLQHNTVVMPKSSFRRLLNFFHEEAHFERFLGFKLKIHVAITNTEYTHMTDV